MLYALAQHSDEMWAFVRRLTTSKLPVHDDVTLSSREKDFMGTTRLSELTGYHGRLLETTMTGDNHHRSNVTSTVEQTASIGIAGLQDNGTVENCGLDSLTPLHKVTRDVKRNQGVNLRVGINYNHEYKL